MSEVAWFALLLRAIGVLVLLQTAPGLVSQVAYLIGEVMDGVLSRSLLVWYIASAAGHVLAIVLGLYLFLGGHRVVMFCTRDLIAKCSVCGYPLTKIVGSVCPECGVPFRRYHADVPQGERRSSEHGENDPS